MDYDYEHRIINIGTRVKAIAVDNLTIPKTYIKALLVSCNDSTGNRVHVWNYVGCEFDLLVYGVHLFYSSTEFEFVCLLALVPPEKPRNLSCVTSDMETVICTWDTRRKRDPSDKNKQTQTLHIL